MPYRDINISVHEMALYINMILNFRDPYTWCHSERVAAISLLIAENYGLDPVRIDEIHIAAHLHDIGKIGIPDHVLLKTGKLDKNEFRIIQKHSRIGHHILNKTPLFEGIAETVLFHHERYDGTGYPEGLRGENIPLESRIIAIADSFDAITSNRPYKESRSFESALAEINTLSGIMYCPASVAHFNNIFSLIPGAFEETESSIISSNLELDMMLETDDILIKFLKGNSDNKNL